MSDNYHFLQQIPLLQVFEKIGEKKFKFSYDSQLDGSRPSKTPLRLFC